MNVVLLTTGRLPRSTFAAARTDLGDEPGLRIDVIAWAPPREHLGDAVDSYLLLGPGRMPAAPAADTDAPDTGAAPADVRAAAVPPPAAAAPPAPAAPAAAPPPTRPAWSPHRIAAGLRRRLGPARKLGGGTVRRLKKTGAWTTLRKLRTDEVARQYWAALQNRRDALELVNDAHVVIALDGRSVRAGWHLARRSGAPKVVFGVQAAVREHAAASASR